MTFTNLDLIVARCENTLGQKPTTCFDCKYHEERAGRDEAIYYCHHPKATHDTDLWGEVIGPEYGTHPGCPISNDTPEPYSTNWALAGPIIAREKIDLFWDTHNKQWGASIAEGCYVEYGSTPIQAAMLCYAAFKTQSLT